MTDLPPPGSTPRVPPPPADPWAQPPPSPYAGPPPYVPSTQPSSGRGCLVAGIVGGVLVLFIIAGGVLAAFVGRTESKKPATTIAGGGKACTPKAQALPSEEGSRPVFDDSGTIGVLPAASWKKRDGSFSFEIPLLRTDGRYVTSMLTFQSYSRLSADTAADASARALADQQTFPIKIGTASCFATTRGNDRTIGISAAAGRQLVSATFYVSTSINGTSTTGEEAQRLFNEQVLPRITIGTDAARASQPAPAIPSPSPPSTMLTDASIAGVVKVSIPSSWDKRQPSARDYSFRLQALLPSGRPIDASLAVSVYEASTPESAATSAADDVKDLTSAGKVAAAVTPTYASPGNVRTLAVTDGDRLSVEAVATNGAFEIKINFSSDRDDYVTIEQLTAMYAEQIAKRIAISG